MERGSEEKTEGSGRKLEKHWQKRFDLICSEYGYIPDEVILELPYFRFCQILEAIYTRIDEERKFYIMVQEETTRFISSIIASTSPITEKGFHTLYNRIKDFSIFKRKKKKKKELPVGGYELAMNFFKGLEGKG